MFKSTGIAGLALLAALAAGAPLQAQIAGGDGPPDAAPPGRPGIVPTVIETPQRSSAERALPVMTVDQDGLYRRSAWGARVQAELERRGREIADENDRLAEQFSSEERELTALRKTLPAEEFRQRADEFDQRVVEIRREREDALRDLQTQADAERTAFFRAILPVLTALMRERGALAVLDQRAIIIAAESIDVTDDLIARMDAEVGAGPEPAAAPQAPEAAAPEPEAAPEAQEGQQGQ